MATHYEILGLNPGAGISEVKTAFRRLAKLYHPDKNPAGKDHFTKILKAYEVLSDPTLKSSYDYRLNNGLSGVSREKKQTTTKTWSFDEKELKRRQYYNDHIKKYTKTNAHFATEQEKKPYNEYKYILFATPLAVALFLLIMALATDPPHTYRSTSVILKTSPILNTGDEPYTRFFGGARFDSTHNQKLLIKNTTGQDVVVCVFSASEFLRSCFIRNNAIAEMGQLPKQSVVILYSSGVQFSTSKTANEFCKEGGFTINPHFYKSSKPIQLTSEHELTLHDGINSNFEEINEAAFFISPVTHS